jgi:hypothetical protein
MSAIELSILDEPVELAVWSYKEAVDSDHLGSD